MKTESGKAAEIYNSEKYIDVLRKLIGSEVEVESLANKRNAKIVTGRVEYVSDEHFGVRISVKSYNYVMSYSYVDLFTGKIKIKRLHNIE